MVGSQWMRCHRAWMRSHTVRSWWACLLSIALLLPMAAFVLASPASAAEGDPEYLQISKSISQSDLSAGDQFTYSILVTCSESECINAAIDDAFPAVLEGFPITNVTMASSVTGTPYTVQWSNGSSQAPSTFGADTTVHVAVQQAISGDNVGMAPGTTFSIVITSQVPDDQSPGVVDLNNKASATADNAQPVTDDAPATITVPRDIAVGVTKDWSPSQTNWAPGAQSTITLGVSNTSNGAVETLILQEPQVAPDGATSLDPSNPSC